MDDPTVAGEELTKSVDQLRIVNLLFGGYGAVFDALLPYMQRNTTRTLRILDVGTGLGDVPAFLMQNTGIRRWDVDMIGIDHNIATVMEARRYLDKRLDRTIATRISVHAADATALPYPDKSFDIAMASMFLNHFSSRDAVAVVTEMDRVSRDGVLINDLHRFDLPYLAAAGLTRLLPATPMIRNDAPLSVARGFTGPELYRIARKAGLTRVRIRWKWAFRWLLISGRL